MIRNRSPTCFKNAVSDRKNKKRKEKIDMATKEEKNKVIKDIKTATALLGETLQARNWEQAYEHSEILKHHLKSDLLGEFTGNELTKLGIEEIRNLVKKYTYFNKEMRKFQGALVANGKRLLEHAK